MKRQNELTDIDDVEFVFETGAARKFRLASGVQVWIPKSMSEWDGKTLTLPTRYAIEKGLV
jgi:hypothetical protein